MDHITTIVKHAFAAIAFVAAAFIAYWAMTIVMWIISWLLVIIATLGAGYMAYEYVRANGVSSLPSLDTVGAQVTALGAKATSLFARFTTKAVA